MGGGGAGTCSYKTWRSMQALGLLRGGGGSWAQTTAYRKFTRFEKIVIFSVIFKATYTYPYF